MQYQDTRSGIRRQITAIPFKFAWGAAALVGLASASALASLSVVNLGNINSDTSWPASSYTGSSPIISSNNGVTGALGSPNSSPVNIQAGGSGDTTGYVVSQTFTATTNFNLGAITLDIGGGSGTSGDSIHLFQLTGVTGSTPSYNLSTEAGPDLLGGGAGLSFTVPAPPTFVEFDLDNTTTSDEVPLIMGDEYAIELWNPNNNAFYISRSGGAQSYLGGLIYNTPTPVAGNITQSDTSSVARGDAGNTRDALFAIYAVPEPTSLSLMVVGAAGLLGRRRRST